MLTLIMDDLERQLGELTQRELVADKIVELSGASHKAAIHDPEGNTIAFAELER